MNEYRIGTKCVQGGYTPGNGEPRQIPIVQSTTFKYATSEDMGKLFDLEASGYFYSRLQNPTNDMVAAKIAEMEGGTAAMLTSSGQAANFFALFNICECGDHIVASSSKMCIRDRYLLGYGAGKLVGMNTSKKRTISIEVGMQNAGLATNPVSYTHLDVYKRQDIH